MTIYIICGGDDLADDVELYAESIGAEIVTHFSRVESHDTAILYLHGQYFLAGPDRIPTANNRVIWNGVVVDAAAMRDLLLTELRLHTGVESVTLIVHACFAAGTVESPPLQAERDSVFGGQLCAAMKALHFPDLRVISYQGQTKSGRAGYAVNAPSDTRRITRRQVDPHAGSAYQVTFGGAGDREGFLVQGPSVTWS